MIWEAIQRYHHGREIVKRRAVPLRITNFEERVAGANRARIAFRRIPPVGNDIVDEWIVEQLAGFVVYGADVGNDGIHECRVEPAGEDESLEGLRAIVVGDGKSIMIAESLIGDILGDEDGDFVRIQPGELDDGEYL